MIMRVTSDRAAGRLPRTPMYGHRHPDIAKRTATLTIDAASNLGLFYTVMLGRPDDAGRMADRSGRGAETFSGINRPST